MLEGRERVDPRELSVGDRELAEVDREQIARAFAQARSLGSGELVGDIHVRVGERDGPPRGLKGDSGGAQLRRDLIAKLTQLGVDSPEFRAGRSVCAASLAEQGELDVAAVDGLPGRQVFAVVGPERAPVLVLPAGALPAYLAYQLVARTLVRRLAGLDETALAEEVATLTHPLDAEPDRTRLALGHHLQGRVVPVRGDLPGAAELAQANALIVIPPGADPVAAHSDVTCWLLD